MLMKYHQIAQQAGRFFSEHLRKLHIDFRSENEENELKTMSKIALRHLPTSAFHQMIPKDWNFHLLENPLACGRATKVRSLAVGHVNDISLGHICSSTLNRLYTCIFFFINMQDSPYMIDRLTIWKDLGSDKIIQLSRAFYTRVYNDSETWFRDIFAGLSDCRLVKIAPL